MIKWICTVCLNSFNPLPKAVDHVLEHFGGDRNGTTNSLARQIDGLNVGISRQEAQHYIVKAECNCSWPACEGRDVHAPECDMEQAWQEAVDANEDYKLSHKPGV